MNVRFLSSLLLVLAMAAGVSLVGCAKKSATEAPGEEKGAMESMGSMVDGAMESAGDTVGGAADSVGGAVDGAVEKVGDAASDTANAVGEKANEAGAAVKSAVSGHDHAEHHDDAAEVDAHAHAEHH